MSQSRVHYTLRTCTARAAVAVERAFIAPTTHGGACVACRTTDGARASVRDVAACLGEASAGERFAAPVGYGGQRRGSQSK